VSGTPVDGIVCDRGPDYWEFSAGAMDCGCSGDNGSNGEGGRVKLYFVTAADGKDLWQSTPSVLCDPSAILPEECYPCEPPDECGDSTVIYDLASNSFSYLTSDCEGDCVDNFDSSKFTSVTGLFTDGYAITRPCCPATGPAVIYVADLQSNPGTTTWTVHPDSDPDCDHDDPNSISPVPEGMTDGDTIIMPCCRVPDYGPYVYGYWRLSVGTLNETTGHNSTRLTFRAAGCEILEYELEPGHCFRCTANNEMRLKTCGPFGCERPPSRVCLIPKMSPPPPE